MSAFTIEIENCNSIEKADIKIFKGALNIKYGPNGLGKSTIARAIVSSVAGNGTLQNLKPFKFRSMTGQHDPVVHGGCKNFCVNGPMAGNCRIARSDDNDRKEARCT